MLFGQASAASSTSAEMLADLDDFGNRKTFADGVERERVSGDVPILAACGTHQVLDAEADVKGAGNSTAVADLANNDIVVQLHLHLGAKIDTPWNHHPQS